MMEAKRDIYKAKNFFQKSPGGDHDTESSTIWNTEA